MDPSRKLDREIEKHTRELAELQAEVTQKEGYLNALRDMRRQLFPSGGKILEATLRPGSDPARAREIISANGKPMHVTDLLQKLGKPVTPESRAALVGSLSSYVRRGEIFTRPAPNTFGLVGTSETAPVPEPDENEGPEPPDDFGRD